MSLRYVLIVVLGMGSGALCYWFFKNQMTEQYAGVLLMTALTIFFYLGDVHVDEVYERDALKAKREHRDWDSY